jgi:hypothetical protein
MRHPQFTLTRTAVHRHTQQRLLDHLCRSDYSTRCTRQVLCSVLLGAAAALISLSAACRRFRNAPSPETVRKALLATLPELAETQRRINRALAGDLPRGLRRRRQRLAIDLTLVPYHGKHEKKVEEVYRGPAKNGTSHFHAYATAYVVRKGRRYTVALLAVAKGAAMADVLRTVLREAARAGVRSRLLLLDRGFYSVAVIRYLQAGRHPFLMPAVCRGRKADHPQGPSGTNVFRSWKTSGWAWYTLTEKGGRTATVAVCVKCRNARGERGKHGRQAWVYAYWGIDPRSWDWVRQTYRQRFGIETSYRQLKAAKIPTTSRRPVVRLFLVGVALLLRNVWVWLHDQVLSRPRRGGRDLQLQRLRFKTLLSWLLQVAEARFGVRDIIECERPSRANT